MGDTTAIVVLSIVLKTYNNGFRISRDKFEELARLRHDYQSLQIGASQKIEEKQ